MRIRIKFRKYGVMRFIGHLDIMRYFQKAMRRANIDIAYSEGFSPHQIMSFAAPLGVGITSDGEYLDIEAKSTKSTQESIAALNAVMVDGIEITQYVALRQDEKKAMTAVGAADYIVYFKNEIDFTQEELEEKIRIYYEERSNIEVTKQTKKSERVIDLKPLIYVFRKDNLDALILTSGDAAFYATGYASRDLYKNGQTGGTVAVVTKNGRAGIVVSEFARRTAEMAVDGVEIIFYPTWIYIEDYAIEGM